MRFRSALELEIFGIMAERDTITLGEQKALCRKIASLLLPPNVTKIALNAIIEQLRMCEYTCEGGPLEKNVAFQALEELAQF